jgi:hypothetical protein
MNEDLFAHLPNELKCDILKFLSLSDVCHFLYHLKSSALKMYVFEMYFKTVSVLVYASRRSERLLPVLKLAAEMKYFQGLKVFKFLCTVSWGPTREEILVAFEILRVAQNLVEFHDEVVCVFKNQNSLMCGSLKHYHILGRWRYDLQTILDTFDDGTKIITIHFSIGDYIHEDFARYSVEDCFHVSDSPTIQFYQLYEEYIQKSAESYYMNFRLIDLPYVRFRVHFNIFNIEKKMCVKQSCEKHSTLFKIMEVKFRHFKKNHYTEADFVKSVVLN